MSTNPDQDAMDFVISGMVLVDLTKCPAIHCVSKAIHEAILQGVIFNREDANSVVRIMFISLKTGKHLYEGSLVGLHEELGMHGEPGAFNVILMNEQAMRCSLGACFDEVAYKVAIEQTALWPGPPNSTLRRDHLDTVLLESEAARDEH